MTRRTYKKVLLAAALPLAVLVILFALDMPMGQPHLKYRFSPVAPLRITSAGIAILIGLGSLAALLFVTKRLGKTSTVPLLIAAACWCALVLWTYLAPPQHGMQHMVNMLSPSHDGAFVLEGRYVDSMRGYLSTDFHERLQLEPDQMHGRRVLSNPPGMTIAAWLCYQTVRECPSVHGFLHDAYSLDELEDPEQEYLFSAALLFAMCLTAAWSLSLGIGYRLCRLWLPPLASLVVAFAFVFNPATVNFSPGKDPAQVTLVAALLLCWLSAYKGNGRRWGLAAGALLAASLTIGLIFIWIILIAAAATLWDALTQRSRLRRWISDCALPTALGAAVVAVAFYVLLEWNLPLTIARIAARYGEIQEGVIADPFYLTLLGVPMFLLFVGPMFWALFALPKRTPTEPTDSIAWRLLVCALIVMASTYFFANNNETPRLWIPFIPLLLIPLAAGRPAFLTDRPDHRKLLLTLLAIQLAGTTLHWSIMDVRESEYRIVTGRLWN